MPINQREKGIRFERQLANKLKEYGYDCRRTAQYCGKTEESSDVVGLPGIHIEAKHQEKMRLYDWMKQAANDAKESGNLPAVFHKKNNEDVLVTMRLDDFMKIYQPHIAIDKEEAFAKATLNANITKKTIVDTDRTDGLMGVYALGQETMLQYLLKQRRNNE